MKEIKISLPPYKMICALFFILILAIVRGISSVNEIGLTIDTYVTLLALVLCADTCYQEIPGGGWEILAIKPGKQQRLTILKRFAVQYVFLIGTAAAGYGLFYLIQQPYIRENELYHFVTAMAATAASIVLFGALPVLISKITGSLWGGHWRSSSTLVFSYIERSFKTAPFSSDLCIWRDGNGGWGLTVDLREDYRTGPGSCLHWSSRKFRQTFW